MFYKIVSILTSMVWKVWTEYKVRKKLCTCTISDNLENMTNVENGYIFEINSQQ